MGHAAKEDGFFPSAHFRPEIAAGQYAALFAKAGAAAFMHSIRR
jgi:hypothetical protein